ncbi:Caspase domain-containing protein [Flavobacterium fluvii]|uniref:Caspase domain-containing protein n=1 Tax=Flavobacterium fluvii TaxID=468056 RepID=A0A1M5HXS7_9FLAO|nr:caspase family protein [Flavobacterium fluvii]SHG20663.1 Caspase domain-containing protein [Flavobacterium fluvii]
MKKIILLLLILSNLQLQAKKRALIIAVGDYPKESGWGSISSLNDVPLVKNSLLKNGFLEEDITVLTDANADKKGILEALTKLQSKIVKGDIIMIHYSGHGQQIFDDNGDEIDGKDEAIVPYDAYARYSDNYKGENHFRDDEIGNVITSFRNKLGKSGQLLMLLDSCHSGSATRGTGEKTRGGEPTFAPVGWKEKDLINQKGSAMFEKAAIDKDAAPFVMITGASADELNYEYEGFGSLSYAFSKAMTDLGTDFSYRQLFSKITTNMNVITPKQTPTIEGDVDYKLFKGEYVAQQTYYEINKIAKPDILQINAGKLNGLFDKTTVFILPAGTSKVDKSKVITTGTITNAGFSSATIKLDSALPDENQKKYWIFVDKLSYGDIALKVYLEPSVTDPVAKEGVSSFLSKNNIGEIVADSKSSDIVISRGKSEYVLSSSHGEETIDKIASTRGSNDVEIINQKIFNYAQGKYLKDLSLKNYNYEFEFKLLPVEYNKDTNTAGELKPENSFYNSSGTFEVNTKDSFVVLQVTNKSERPIYFSIIEINSKGEINPFMPNGNCTLNNNERKLEPGKTMIFKDCVYSFGPPYERLILKGFATSTPINFQPTVQARGAGSRGVGENPLENFIQQSYAHSRGAEANSPSEKIDGFSAEFVYEIVK